MNSERLKTLTNIYISRYEDIIKGDDDPRDKWVAAAICSRTFDLNAADFGKMFDAAMKRAGSFIDENSAKPTDGIRLLCKKGRADDVQNEFDLLLDNDGGDIDARQERVRSFVKNINAMLQEIAPEKWQYRQKIRTGIRYLAFIRPEDNYLFRASEAAAFAGFAEVEEEIGYDRKLNLNNYYKTCDELADYLASREDLTDLVDESLREKGKEAGIKDLEKLDPKCHLLAYDMIHCAYVYDFYSDKAATRKSKISTVQQRRIDRMRQSAKLLEEREKTIDHLEEVEVRESLTKVPSVNGRKVQHKAFGTGKITSQDGRYLTVQFDSISKKFALPGVVVNGYLAFTNSDKVADACRELSDVMNEHQKTADELNSIDVQLKMLEA